ICFVPATSDTLAGSAAWRSLQLRPTRSVTLLIMFQFSSTALMVRLNAASGDWALGVPVLPVGFPGAAFSPGVKTRSFLNGPALTAIGVEVALVTPGLLNRIVMVSAAG